MDFLDLIEEGNLGSMHAADKFDPKRGFRFSTYVAYRIEQAVRRAYDEQSKTIRIPPHALEALRKWLREWDRMSISLGRNPTLQEMGKKLNLSARQIKSIIDAHEAAKSVGSSDTPSDEDSVSFSFGTSCPIARTKGRTRFFPCSAFGTTWPTPSSKNRAPGEKHFGHALRIDRPRSDDLGKRWGKSFAFPGNGFASWRSAGWRAFDAWRSEWG